MTTIKTPSDNAEYATAYMTAMELHRQLAVLREQAKISWDAAIKDFPSDSRDWTAEQNAINSRWVALYEYI